MNILTLLGTFLLYCKDSPRQKELRPHTFIDESGQSMVFAAVLMSVLLGFGALAVDVGYMNNEKGRLQNALDAACLAAAQELPDEVKASTSANEYIQLNGYEPDDISIGFADCDSTVEIAGTKAISFGFAKILGIDGTNIQAEASAEKVKKPLGGAFNYAIFSGSTTNQMQFACSNFIIEGSVHSNHKFNLYISNTDITGAVEAVKTIDIQGSNIDVGPKLPNASIVEMPDFSAIIKSQAQEAGTYYTGNKTYNGSNFNAESAMYVEGDLQINASNFTGNGIVVANGNITINTSNLENLSSSAVCFYSNNGNININASNVDLNGIVYAPRGKISINCSNVTVHGRVIGNEVTSYASNITIISAEKDLDNLPSTSFTVKLTK
ncbi:MAG: Tad domain-containing protein [Sedimentibacter sp.]|uniref:Tad domain-containing protein n=1 Tax=Sedimentibacter sp. TaxID=1960295 RepID=UPI002982403F|nr:Tad domain-containing protein [Sedimentibacter sp.]MDW5298703.1 Tad domain-containing protein [Sedimentibacter sp.]